jgi:tetratricopeptide (TPR) repeat protein
MGLFSNRISGNGEIFLNDGLKAHERNDAVKAIELLEKSLQKLPSNDTDKLFQAYLFLGVNYKRVNNLQVAYNMYKNASELARGYENITEVHNAFGKTCYLLNKQAEAVANYMIAINAATRYTTAEEFNVIGGNLCHHLGHALADFDSALPHDFKVQIPEYKKSIMGQPNHYNKEIIFNYVDIGIDYWKKRRMNE